LFNCKKVRGLLGDKTRTPSDITLKGNSINEYGAAAISEDRAAAGNHLSILVPAQKQGGGIHARGPLAAAMAAPTHELTWGGTMLVPKKR